MCTLHAVQLQFPGGKDFQKKNYRLCSIMVCILHHHPNMMCILHIRMMPYITSGKDQSCHQSVPLPLCPLRVTPLLFFWSRSRSDPQAEDGLDAHTWLWQQHKDKQQQKYMTCKPTISKSNNSLKPASQYSLRE